MKYYPIFISVLFLWMISSCKSSQSKKNISNCQTVKVDEIANTYIALFSDESPTIDGVANECCWSRATWDTLQYRWLGDPYTPEDFSGRYKAVWKDSLLFLLVEIHDDKLNDTHPDPLINYWDDDCVEVFIDEDNSGGDHQYNHSAFAYHISPVMNVVDMGTDKKPRLFNDHVNGAILMDQNKYTWELAIKIYPKNFDENSSHNIPVTLKKGKIIGFSLAYCDSDTTDHRENFIGSVNKKEHYEDLGWINADSFGKMILE